MAEIEPYSLEAANSLVKDAEVRQGRRHEVWKALERLYRRGEVHGTLTGGDVEPILLEEMPGLTLDGINLVLPNMQFLINQSMAHDPAFLVEPFRGGDASEAEARFAEQLLSYFWKRVDGTDIHRSMVQDMVVLGNGFCKVGWAFLEEAADREDEELVAELMQLAAVEERDADLQEREPRSPGELAELIDLEEPRVVMDEPFVEYVSPYDVLVPRDARRMEECRWIAQRVILPADEVEANEEFDEEAREALRWSARSESRPDRRADDEDDRGATGFDAGKDEKADPFREVTLFEFYDMRARRLMVFQQDGEKALYEDDLPYAHRYTPFVHMRNLEDGGRRFWSFGDVENIASIQEEFNQYVFDQMSQTRRAGNRYFVEKSMVTDEMRTLLTSEQPDVVVPVDIGNQNIQDVVQAVQRHPVPAELFQAKHDLQQSMRDVLGINEMQAGGTGPDRMSATAAAVVDGNATLRGSDKKWQVERSAADTGQRILLLCQEFLDEEFALRVVGPHGDVQWLDVSRDELTGEFGVNVNSGSTMAVNPATRMQRALDVMTQIIPALAQDGYDTEPMWRQAIRDYGMDPDRMLRRLSPEEMESAPGGGGPEPGGVEETVPQERMGGPPVPAAVEGAPAL